MVDCRLSPGVVRFMSELPWGAGGGGGVLVLVSVFRQSSEHAGFVQVAVVFVSRALRIGRYKRRLALSL